MVMNEMVRVWHDGSVMMRSEAEGALYLHILQPSQYWSGGKVLSTEEPTNVYNAQLDAVRWIPEGYRRMLALDGDLLDANPAFRNVRDSVFRDTCCHPTDVGYEVLADFVTRESAARIAAAQTPPAPGPKN